MTDAYRQLIEATIQELEALRARGVRNINVSPEVLAQLGRPVSRRGPSLSATVSGSAAGTPSPVKSPPPEPPRKPVFKRPAPQPPPPVPAGPAAVTQAVPSLDPARQGAAFAALREQVLACVKCPHLVSSRRTVVFGVGNPNADLMFVGEAPGADEDEQGEPFVGKAGQLLTRIIETMGLSREKVYIGNILKCRPDTPGQSAGNRKPTGEEMQTCIPWLHQQIDLIRPKVLVALGATAVEGLLGKTVGITRLRGNWQTYRGIPLMPTYHPAYLLRNQALSEKRKVWEDMLAVMEKLQMPINSKQQGYFRRSA